MIQCHSLGRQKQMLILHGFATLHMMQAFWSWISFRLYVVLSAPGLRAGDLIYYGVSFSLLLTLAQLIKLNTYLWQSCVYFGVVLWFLHSMICIIASVQFHLVHTTAAVLAGTGPWKC